MDAYTKLMAERYDERRRIERIIEEKRRADNRAAGKACADLIESTPVVREVVGGVASVLSVLFG